MFSNRKKHESGFTIVELLIAVSLSTIIIASLISTINTFSQQYSIVSVRQNLNTDAKNAIEMINDDIRNSTSVSLYNVNPDNNAPASATGSYADVTGGPNSDPTASNYSPTYNWRMGTNIYPFFPGLTSGRLILIQPARDASNKPIYYDQNNLSGPVNVVVYYVKNYTMYRRVIAGNGNNTSTISCSPVESDGGCTNPTGKVDQVVVRNMNTADGQISFQQAYYNSNRQFIAPRDLGNGHYDYSPYANAKTLYVAFQLGRNQAGQPLVEIKGALTQMRSDPAIQSTQKNIFPASLSVGPGGINSFWNSQINAQSISTQGKISGSFSSSFGTPDKPTQINAANKNCGSGNSYGTVLCSDSPISLTQNATITGNVCATGLSTNPSTYSNSGGSVQPGNNGTQYTAGVQSNCTAPDVSMPTFDKTSYVSGLGSAQAPGGTASCNGASGSPTSTIASNTKYTSDVNLYWSCQADLQGSIYIKGALNISFGAIMKVAESVTTRPTVVVNGPINLSWNAKVIPNSKGIAPYFISFDSSNSCSNTDLSCSSFSNTDLQNSVSRSSISFSYGAEAPSSIFYAYYGGMDIYWNGEVEAGSLAAQRISTTYGAQINLSQ